MSGWYRTNKGIWCSYCGRLKYWCFIKACRTRLRRRAMGMSRRKELSL